MKRCQMLALLASPPLQCPKIHPPARAELGKYGYEQQAKLIPDPKSKADDQAGLVIGEFTHYKKD